MANFTNDILLGLDGGGTGCRIAIADGCGAALGHAKGGPANPTFRPEEALTNILAAIEAARSDAGISLKALKEARAFVGLAGIRDDEMAAFIAKGLPIKNAQVVEDRITTVTGALAGNDGAVAAIGTGSFLARTVAGEARYIGGWGFELGDQASGAWLGRKLLRQVVLCVEGVMEHTDLTRQALALYGGSANTVYDFSIKASPADFGNLAPLVVGAAEMGDQNATGLMRSGADYIVKGLNALGHQMDEVLCLTGGLGPHYATYLPHAYSAHLIKPKGSALEGALLLAAKMEPLS